MTQNKRLLSPVAAKLIEQMSRQPSGTAIAASTLCGIAMLYGKSRIKLAGPLPGFLAQCERVFVVLPITAAIAVRSIQFAKPFPVDPTDRLIGATAVIHGLRLVTADKAIRNSGEVDCVW